MEAAMPPQVNRVTADMSHLLWQAKVYELTPLEVKRRFDALRERHLELASDQERGRVGDELELWAGRVDQLFHPALLPQAI